MKSVVWEVGNAILDWSINSRGPSASRLADRGLSSEFLVSLLEWCALHSETSFCKETEGLAGCVTSALTGRLKEPERERAMALVLNRGLSEEVRSDLTYCFLFLKHGEAFALDQLEAGTFTKDGILRLRYAVPLLGTPDWPCPWSKRGIAKFKDVFFRMHSNPQLDKKIQRQMEQGFRSRPADTDSRD